MTQEEEIDLALWQYQASDFLMHWLKRHGYWDEARIYYERRNQPGDFERANKCARVRDHYRARIDRYVEALGFVYVR
jgi:hypothetical protein